MVGSGVIRRVVLLLGLAVAPAGASEWLRFETVSLDQGLSQLSIVSSMQDERGFLWFGTQAGLNRYDGYEFRVYKRTFGSNGSGLSDNYIRSLAQTADGMIWAGTNSGGLNRLDPRSGHFSTWRSLPGNPAAPANDQIRALTVEDGRVLWIGTGGGGLDRFDPQADSWTHHDALLPSSIVNALLIHQNDLWVATAAGAVRIDLSRGELADPFVLGAGHQINALARTPDGMIWAGSENGLLRFDPQSGTERRYRHSPAHSDSLAFDLVESLLVDRGGTLWIGTTRGLNRYVAATDSFQTWRHDPFDLHSLPADRIASILQDRSGILWFGTWTGGAAKLNQAAIAFRGYRARAGDPDSLQDSRVRDFLEARDGRLWVATLGGGLSRLNPATDRFETWRYDPADPSTIGSDELHAIARDRDGILWLGSRDAGISRFDPDSGSAVRIPHRADDPASPAGDHVLDVLVDRSNRLWVGTLDSGVSRLDIASGQWRHYRHDPDDPASLSNDTVGHLFEDTQGTLWLGTRGSGFNLYREESDDFLRVEPGPGADQLVHGSVTYFHETDGGQIWIGTQGGGFGEVLERGPRAEDFRFRFVNSAQGLPSDAVGAVMAGDGGRLWASTLVGISAYDPATDELDNFFPIHGTQTRAYYVGAGIKTSEGTLYFGGLDGITRLRPTSFPQDATPPQVALTQLLINNQPVAPGAENSPLPRAISFVDMIQLDYTQNIFSLEFAGLHFAEPAKNRYRYQLVGFDPGWVETPATRRHATYTNLDPGIYTFRVQAANRDGVWSETREMGIEAAPPPWRTGWAYLGYVLAAMAVSVLIGWVRHRQQAAERQAQKAIRESEERLKLALWGSGDEMWYLDLPSGAMQRLSYGRAMEIRTERPVDNLETLWSIMHPDDRGLVESAMNRHLQGHSPYFEASYRVRGRDGQWLWAMSKGRVVQRSAEGQAEVLAGATKDVTQLKNTERALRELNERLESMVDERTVDLQRANADLKKTLEMLTEAQSQLVESEKMASLGNLVAGVAHEINTPVGVAVTAATYMRSQVERTLRELEREQPDPAVVTRFCEKELKNIDFVIQNLNRAAELIKSFKQVAVDQSSEERRRFHIAGYIDEILTSLQPKIKRTSHRVDIDCDPELEMESYPGALYQVLSNLLMNSLVHGLVDQENGRIILRVRQIGDRVVFDYRDNGRGFGPEVEARIFEPFFTTRRGHGGSGLGMHIVFNLVTQVLRGRISCKGKPGKGIEVRIEIPREISGEAAA